MDLAQAEFTYNYSPNRSRCMSPFQIVYAMHPRGVYELRDLGKQEKRSVEGEDFAVSMHGLQETIKKRLHESVEKYKQRTYLKRREVNFQNGDLVMAYLKKQRFPKGTYNKLKLKKIGRCKVLRKFSANAYEIELPSDLQISSIFNVSDLYRFINAGIQPYGVTSDRDDPTIDWQGQIPQKES